MTVIHFSIFVFIATLLFYFLLRKYNTTVSARNRLYITLYIPVVSLVVYFLFLKKYMPIGETKNIEEIKDILDDGSLMSDLFRSSVDI